MANFPGDNVPFSNFVRGSAWFLANDPITMSIVGNSVAYFDVLSKREKNK
jgi:hypothetical protein